MENKFAFTPKFVHTSSHSGPSRSQAFLTQEPPARSGGTAGERFHYSFNRSLNHGSEMTYSFLSKFMVIHEKSRKVQLWSSEAGYGF